MNFLNLKEKFKEVYPLEINNKFLLYIPLDGKILICNKNAFKTIIKIKDNKNDFSEKEINFIEKVAGFISFKYLTENKDSISRWTPTYVTLLLTNRCNLNCIYCYSNSGTDNITMSYNAAKAAMDLVIKNAINIRQKAVYLNFMGGGEPTVAKDLLVKCTEYFKKTANKKFLKPSISLTTNCQFSIKSAKWIASNVNSALVSFDGFEEIQNTQRPLKTGKGSYQRVKKNLKLFDSLGFKYNIRSTVTKQSIYQLPDIVRHFASNFGCKSYHFEPIFVCGRANKKKLSYINFNDYIYYFNKAQQIGFKLNKQVWTSLCTLERISVSFCNASKGPSFIITPDGLVTACVEVSDSNDIRSEILIYGKYNTKNNSFIINKNKIKTLKQFNLTDYPECENCFAKWHCSGDCLSHNIYLNPNKHHHFRCEFIKKMTIIHIGNLLNRGELRLRRNIKLEKIPV